MFIELFLTDVNRQVYLKLYPMSATGKQPGASCDKSSSATYTSTTTFKINSKPRSSFNFPSPFMPPFHFFEVDGKPIDGVYGQLDFATFKKYTRVPGRPLTSCALCGQESKYVKEDGVDLKMCRGVR